MGMAKPKICPECDHEFQHGWDGIDSHWRSKTQSDNAVRGRLAIDVVWPIQAQRRIFGEKESARSASAPVD
jgi:hypothetical protein